MNKKVLVIGTGMDVTEQKRGEFINEYFDEIIIVKYGVNFLETFKEYTGSPTILVAPGTEWYKKTYVELMKSKYVSKFNAWWDNDKLRMARDRIYTNIKKSRIKEAWINPENRDIYYFYPFCVSGKNVLNQRVRVVELTPNRNTTGMNAIDHAIEKYGKVHYMGFDGHLKGVHYYHHLENTMVPWKTPEECFDHNQYFGIKLLERRGLLEHIDKLL